MRIVIARSEVTKQSQKRIGEQQSLKKEGRGKPPPGSHSVAHHPLS
jgi:hypothetical protein